MELRDQIMLTKIAAERLTFRGDSDIRKGYVIEVTDYSDGIVELHIGENEYLRFQQAELETAMMAARLIKDILK